MHAMLAEVWATLTDPWGLFGLLAQGLFFSSFFVQWIVSERAGRSVVPLAFWYIRLTGGVMLFTYAFFGRQDGVIALGQSMGVLIYMRNLMLIGREKRRAAAAGGPAD